MSDNYIILYIHGMGGGGDSRIPSVLRDALGCRSVDVVCRTYSFDPEEAYEQISCWIDELSPDLIIGESLGSLHALRHLQVPCILVSPALNAPYYFGVMAWLTLIPGFTMLFDRIYRPREGDRQKLHFTFPVLRKYIPHRRAALLMNEFESCSHASLHAFFGTYDHYRRSGVVSVRTWEKYFGSTFSMYEGSHFMEEEHIYTKLIPEILSVLNNR